jgi:methylenetetrahydrofolate dehydrogenase (NADP+)/methenyltetrahydrofolate cyclohydrolase
MIIDGKAIADTLLDTHKTQTSLLKSKGITPTLAVILVGEDPGSISYVRQKEKTAERIGAKLRYMKYDVRCTKEEIQSTIQQLNNDPTVHGIIIQLPRPPHFDISIHRSVHPDKDVDGFVPGSKFKVPVALAVEKILQQSYKFQMSNDKSMQKLSNETMKQFTVWLNKQRIVVVGRGETAGKPIVQYFINQGCNVSVVHSHTSDEEKQQKIQNADIVISCVG